MGLDRTGKSAFIDVIDVCPSVQRNISWEKVADAGFKGVVVKSSLYSSTPVLAFDQYAEGASKAGLAVGAYHFAYCGADPVAQAEFFLRRMRNFGLRPGDIPPMLDLEFARNIPGLDVVNWGGAFMDRIEREMKHLHLRSRPTWYTFPNFTAGLPLAGSVLSRCQLVLARYRANKGPTAAWYPEDGWRPDLVPKGCPEPVMCQYSGNDGLPVPGIAGSCDRNVFFGSQGDWADFRGLDRPPSAETLGLQRELFPG